MSYLRAKEVIEKDHEARKAEAALVAKRQDDDINVIVAQPEGRRFIRRLLGPEITRVYTDGFDKENSVHCYKQGRRSVGIDLMNLIDAASKNNLIKLMQTKQEDY